MKALEAMTRNTTPDKDKVTNKVFWKLDDTSIEALTGYFNEQWEQGTIPAECEQAEIVLTPKAGKPTKLDRLRPISTTSCFLACDPYLPATIYTSPIHLSAHNVRLPAPPVNS